MLLILPLLILYAVLLWHFGTLATFVTGGAAIGWAVGALLQALGVERWLALIVSLVVLVLATGALMGFWRGLMDALRSRFGKENRLVTAIEFAVVGSMPFYLTYQFVGGFYTDPQALAHAGPTQFVAALILAAIACFRYRQTTSNWENDRSPGRPKTVRP